MTESERRLLIKDICARLPYGIVVHYVWKDHTGKEWPSDLNLTYFSSDEESVVEFLEEEETVKPYLRPMSSMTEEERKHFESLCCWGKWESGPIITLKAADWLNENHFDYHLLIPMGLALEAPEGMYRTE
jgi:hypothetical protein